MKVDGRAFWRSAGKRPWYNEMFERRGFRVFPLQIREGDTMYLDRVNMYPRYGLLLMLVVGLLVMGDRSYEVSNLTQAYICCNICS
jgi:hypothetical protein